MKEIRKEVLTKEIIQRELKTIYLLNRKWDIAFCVLLGIFAIFSFSNFLLMDGSEDFSLSLFFVCFFLVNMLYTIFKIRKTLYIIQNDGVIIETDALMECEEKLS